LFDCFIVRLFDCFLGKILREYQTVKPKNYYTMNNNTTNYLSLEKIDAYNTSYELSNYVWKMVMSWDSFAK